MTLLLGTLMGIAATAVTVAFAGDLRNLFCDHKWRHALDLPHVDVWRCDHCGKITRL